VTSAAAAAFLAVGSDFFKSGFMPSIRGTFNFTNFTLVELARAEWPNKNWQ
jgi:hypothetical protein